MSEMNRREFAEALALAALVPMVPGGAGAIRLPAFITTSAEADPSALAKALAGVIRAQYGDRLSEQDLATITRQIETGLERADKVRKAGALANGDEPDFVFSAVREGPAV